jgi:hypothetical protein
MGSYKLLGSIPVVNLYKFQINVRNKNCSEILLIIFLKTILSIKTKQSDKLMTCHLTFSIVLMAIEMSLNKYEEHSVANSLLIFSSSKLISFSPLLYTSFQMGAVEIVF